jgi:hypothetical protein
MAHHTINSAKVLAGGRPWKSFEIKYTGKKPENPPEWMSATYEIWYRDPVQLFADMLANQDFKDEWDAAPLRQYNSSGERVWCNLMFGNWAWKQCARHSHIQELLFELTVITRIKYLLRTRRQKALPSAQLYWAVTRQLYRSLQAKTNTIHCTHLSVTCITMSVVDIASP